MLAPSHVFVVKRRSNTEVVEEEEMIDDTNTEDLREETSRLALLIVVRSSRFPLKNPSENSHFQHLHTLDLSFLSLSFSLSVTLITEGRASENTSRRERGRYATKRFHVSAYLFSRLISFSGFSSCPIIIIITSITIFTIASTSPTETRTRTVTTPTPLLSR